MFRLSAEDDEDLRTKARRAGYEVVSEFIRERLGYPARLFPEARGSRIAKKPARARARKR